MQMRQRDVAALDAKYTKELMLKLKMMLCDDVAAGRRRLHIKKQSVSQCVKLPLPLAWIMQRSLPPTGDTAEILWDYFTLRERLDHYAKQNWKGTAVTLMSSADRVAHIDGHPA